MKKILLSTVLILFCLPLLSMAQSGCSQSNVTAGSPTAHGVYGTNYAAADLIVNSGENFQLTTVTPELWISNGGTFLSVTLSYYADNNGSPGVLIGSETVTPASQTLLNNAGWYKYEVTLNVTPFIFSGQTNTDITYWIGISNGTSTTNDTYWGIDQLGGNYLGYFSGNSGSSWTQSSWDCVYEFIGDCIPITGSTYGCTDPGAMNYDPLADTDDGSCIATVYGCMDSTAIFYNPLANTDDSTCYYCSITTNVISWLSSSLSACDGWISVTPSGTAPYTYTWSNGDTTDLNEYLCDGAYTYTVIDSNGCGFTETIILTNHVGCTDSTAFNYDPTAIVDDGSCIALVYGCTDSMALNYNPLANTDDGSCIPYIYGCMDSTAANYDLTANTDDGSCTYCYAVANIANDSITSCNSSILISTNIIINGSYAWNTSNVSTSLTPPIGAFHQGGVVFWLDPNDNTHGMICDIYELANSANYNGLAEWGCYGTLVGADGTVIGTGEQNTIDIVNGCSTAGTAAELCYNSTNGGYTDWYLPSFDELLERNQQWALINQGSINNGGDALSGIDYWSSSEVSSLDAHLSNYGSSLIWNKDYACKVRAIRSFNPPDITNFSVMVSTSGWNYVTVTDSVGCSATDSVYVHIDICGCTDPTAFNYNPSATLDDGTCIATVYGCMDSTAIFYNPNANTDDGTCIYCDISISQLNIDTTAGACNGFVYVQATSSYPIITYTWSNGFVGVLNMGLCLGMYTVIITDSVGCTVDSTIEIGNVVLGCTDSIATNYNPLANTDDGTCTYQMTYVPDDNFEQALINLGYDNVLDDFVITANINTVTSLDVSNDSIADLTGIEDFTALTSLVCSDNQLTSLDVSNHTALIHLYCHNNQITSLDVSTNTALTEFMCSTNLLSILDVSTNTALILLNCNSNQLTILDVSTNIALRGLYCDNNFLTSLDVSLNLALEGLAFPGNNLTSLDVSANTNLIGLGCHDNFLTSLDVSLNLALEGLSCDNNQLTSLDVSTNTALNHLHCGWNQLTSLDVSQNIALRYLYCNYNQLDSLDVSSNINLIALECNNNFLTSLDLTTNTLLASLICHDNQLTNLNVSANDSLEYLICYSNQLTSLDVRNGNNTNFNYFESINNPNLSCISVDDHVYSSANWTNIDPWTSFSPNCATAYGCTDSLATNYNPLATLDDGSCIPTVYGCTDPSALNYNSLANTDDSTCCGLLPIAFGTQIGLDIDGDAAGDNSGRSVSMNSDGSIMAIGGDGSTRIFNYNGTTWNQLGNNLPGGSSVSLSSDGSIVALSDGNIYSYNGTSWVQLGSNTNGGYSVSLSSGGHIVAIGNRDWGSSDVRVYSWDGLSWQQRGSDIDRGHGGEGDFVSLSSDGNTIAIGDANWGNAMEGRVRIFTFNGTSWNQLGQDIQDAPEMAGSGHSVSLSSDGNTVAISAPFHESGNPPVRIYTYNSTSWNQLGQTLYGVQMVYNFGWSVSLSADGNTVAIGASASGDTSGYVRIYQNVGSSWSQTGNDIHGEVGVASGYSVSLSDDGNKVAIGAPDIWGASSGHGHVRVFSVGNTSPPCSGCTDSLAANYDPYSLIDDSSCITAIYGCTDSLALNYDPIANADDNTCYYCSITTNVIPWFSSSLSACNGFISVTPTSGSSPYTYTWSNGSTSNFNNNLCDGAYTYTVIDANGCGFTETIILTTYLGCMDSTAMNYDPTAIVDDGSCIASVYGCTDSMALNYNPLANTDDGSCIPYIYGCMDSTATNYDLTANTDDGSCTYCYATADINNGLDSISECDSVLLSTNVIAGGSYCWNSLNSLNTGLVAYYPFNGNANDESGNGNTGTVNGATLTTDRFGNANSAYIFDLNKYITIPSSNNLDLLSDFTISLWAQFDTNANLVNEGVFVSKDFNFNVSGWSFMWGSGSENMLKWHDGLTHDTGNNSFDPTAFNSTWYHLVITKQGTNMIFYVNGVSISSNTCNHLLLPNNLDVKIGGMANDNHAFDGKLDDVGLYNLSLSEIEIQALYNNLLCINTSNSITVTNSGWNYVTVTDSLGCTATDSVYVHIDICGCTDPTALNYNPSATSDDGSCIATVYGCMDSTAINYAPTSNLDDGSCIYCDITISQLAITNPSPGTCDGWVYVQATSSYPPITYTWSNGFVGSFNMSLCTGVYTVTITDNYGCSVDTTVSIGNVVMGCTDSTATNYDPNANIDDGSCIYGSSTSCNYNIYLYDNGGDGWITIPQTSIDNKLEVYINGILINTITMNNGYGPEIYSFLVPTGGTFETVFVTGGPNPSECAYFIEDNQGQLITDGAGNIISAMGLITSPSSPFWPVPAGIPPSPGFSVMPGNFGPITSTSACTIYGCTDSTAFNYDATANTDDGSCDYCGIFSIHDTTICLGSTIAIIPSLEVYSLPTFVNFATSSLPATIASVSSGYTIGIPCGPNPNGGQHLWFGSGSVIPRTITTVPLDVSSGGNIDFDLMMPGQSGSCDGPDLFDEGIALEYKITGGTWTIINYFDPMNGAFYGWNTYSFAMPFSAQTSATEFRWQQTQATATTYDFWGIDEISIPNVTYTGSLLWSTGDTTSQILVSPSQNTSYWVQVIDSSGTIICTDTFNVNVTCIYGCTDTTACNYNPLADTDDGLCEWTSCGATCGAVTGVNLTDVIHDRSQFNWDDMNSTTCVVDQIRIRYREAGTSTYSNKTMGSPVGNNAPCTNTSKLVLNLTASTVYEYDFKIWYQDGTVVNWHANGSFTTADVCVNATNMTATPTSTSATAFCWDAPASPWAFVRLQYRENVPGSSFSNIGGFGVMAPALCKTKNGLTAGTQYRVMWRTWCNVTGGPYRSPVWDGPVIWDQPSSIRLEGGTTIANLEVYPNPSRDIFNVTFTSETIQDLKVRILNIVGEELISDDLEQFVGEYTKQINLEDNAKGIYFLEIETENGIINKKLILQ